MRSPLNVVLNNLKLVAVGAVAVLVAGTGAATTVTLSGSESDAPDAAVVTVAAPASTVSPSDTATVGIAPDDESDDASDTPTVGIRPTDTHGYCVSHAVQSATATAGISLGSARSTAAHSCPKPNKPHKATKAPKPHKPAKAKPTKPAKRAKAHQSDRVQAATTKQHGRPAADKPRGKSGAHGR